MIDTIAGAKASAIIYSIAETAKANHLNPFLYFELVLTEIPKHMEDTDGIFLKKLELAEMFAKCLSVFCCIKNY